MALRDRGAVAFVLISGGLAAFSAIAAAISIFRERLGPNGAAWIQAAGSIAAITGAVWLFRSQAAERRRERRAAGEEVAWAVRFALTNAQREARTIAFEVVDEHLLENEDPTRHWLLRSENCRNVLRVFAERTDHLHPALNHIASNGVLLLRQMDEEIGRASEFVRRGEHPSIAVATEISRYGDYFENLLNELDSRMRGILVALDRGGDAFPKDILRHWAPPQTASGGRSNPPSST